jgi:hypothetical protein
MEELKPVEKAGWNDFHKYEYARMQDLSTALTPLMGKHGIVVFQNELSRDMFDDGRAMAVRYQFTIVHKSGEIWPERPVITGVSMCRTSNGKYDDKAFNKCHTSARKYFLISLFQIPTEDHDDADSDGGSGNRPRPARRAPSPDGKHGPQLIPINHGELPAAWGERFIKAIGTATKVEEVNAWYDANFAIFEKIKKAGDTATYDALIDAMDDRERALVVPQQTAQAQPAEAADDFPGDKKPTRQRRAPAAKADDPISSGPIQIDEEQWLAAISNAYSACEDTTSLALAQGKHMTHYKDRVSPEAWQRAADLTAAELARIEGASA